MMAEQKLSLVGHILKVARDYRENEINTIHIYVHRSKLSTIANNAQVLADVVRDKRFVDVSIAGIRFLEIEEIRISPEPIFWRGPAFSNE